MKRTPKTLSYETPPELRTGTVVIGRSRIVPAAFLALGSVMETLCFLWKTNPFGTDFRDVSGVCIGIVLLDFGLWGLIDRSPLLIIDDGGFTDFSDHLGRVSWGEIAGVRTGRRNRGTYLYVQFKDRNEGYRVVSETADFRRPWDALPNEATLLMRGFAVKPDVVVQMMRQRMDRK
jgi:hypothetical protein